MITQLVTFHTRLSTVRTSTTTDSSGHYDELKRLVTTALLFSYYDPFKKRTIRCAACTDARRQVSCIRQHMMDKWNRSQFDPFMSMLEFRNTSTKRAGSSPAQCILNRRTKTMLKCLFHDVTCAKDCSLTVAIVLDI